jgi:hypothetical protein
MSRRGSRAVRTHGQQWDKGLDVSLAVEFRWSAPATFENSVESHSTCLSASTNVWRLMVMRSGIFISGRPVSSVSPRVHRRRWRSCLLRERRYAAVIPPRGDALENVEFGVGVEVGRDSPEQFFTFLVFDAPHDPRVDDVGPPRRSACSSRCRGEGIGELRVGFHMATHRGAHGAEPEPSTFPQRHH